MFFHGFFGLFSWFFTQIFHIFADFLPAGYERSYVTEWTFNARPADQFLRIFRRFFRDFSPLFRNFLAKFSKVFARFFCTFSAHFGQNFAVFFALSGTFFRIILRFFRPHFGRNWTGDAASPDSTRWRRGRLGILHAVR